MLRTPQRIASPTTKLQQPLSARLPAPLVLCLPLFVTLLWHLSNRALPNDDGANFATTATQVARAFDQGVWSGLKAAFELRGWRPTLFPLSAVPGLLCTGLDLIASVALTQLLIQIALIAYSYGLLRLLMVDQQVSALVAAAIVSLPGVLVHSLTFFSEAAWLLTSLGCLYHLLRARVDADVRHVSVAGLYGGLALCIRPVESALLVIVWLLTHAGSASGLFLTDWRSKTSLAFAVLPGLLLLLSLKISQLTPKILWSVVFASLIIGHVISRAPTNYLTVFFRPAGALACLWWAGFMSRLFSWMYEASFGSVAQITDRRFRVSPLAGLTEIVRHYGLVQVSIFLGAGVVSYVFLQRMSQAQPLPRKALFDSVWKVASSSAVLFLGLYWTSGTGDPRRVLVSLVLSCLCVGVMLGSIPWRMCRMALPTAVLAINTMVALGAISGYAPRIASGFAGVLPTPNHGEEGNIEMARLVTKSVPDGASVAVYTQALFIPTQRIYEPAALQLALLQLRSKVSAGYIFQATSERDLLSKLRQANYHYLLLDSLHLPGLTGNPYLQFIDYVWSSLREGKESELGFWPVWEKQMGGRSHLLFRLVNFPKDVASQLAPYWGKVTAVASSEQKGYPAINLMDGTEDAWGSSEGNDDVYALLNFPEPVRVSAVHVRLFSPAGRAHLRDVRVAVGSGCEPSCGAWRFVRSRLAGQSSYRTVIAVPELPDSTEVVFELDPADADRHPGRQWGIACLRSQGDAPNYLKVGTGVYIREMWVRFSAAAQRQNHSSRKN